MFPWKNIVSIDKNAPTPVYLQIVGAIIKEIMAGRLISGQKMPGTRYLSEQLDINRKTVVAAYDELMAQAWLDVTPSQGTFISQTLPIVRQRQWASGSIPSYQQLHTAAFSLSFLPSDGHQTEKKEMLRITDGSPDVRIAPMDNLYKRCREIASGRSRRQYLRYGDEQGEISLRKALAHFLHTTRGLSCSPQQLLITRGSQMGLYLIFQLLLKTGDYVIVGESSYPVANEVIRKFQGRLLTVPVDEQGLQVEVVASLCRQYPIRAMYITPHHHYPTTVTLSAERRVRLLGLAQQYRFAIVEDDYDYDFHYASSPLLPLISMDTQGVVIYIGSLTKCMAPALRNGYVVAPENVIQALTQYRKLIDRQGDLVLEKAMAAFIEAGELQRHLKKSLKIYRQRRDDFCTLLQQQLGEWIHFQVPDGGMAVWVVFASDIDLLALAKYAHTRGISLEGVQDWHRFQAIRLGFASLNAEEMQRGVEVLKEGITSFKRKLSRSA